MKSLQRVVSTFLVVTMLAGFLPEPAHAQATPTPGYNPYTGAARIGDPRYDRGLGRRYDPNYYQPGYGTGYQGGHGFTRLLPPLVGGVVGLAMGAKFGLVGAVIGGAIGLFGGQAITRTVFGDSYYGGQGAYQPPVGGMAQWIPGAVGAAIGAFLGSSFGVVGMLVGGGIGFLAARAVSRLLFPNVYYGYGAYNVPGAYGGYGPYASQDAAEAAVGESPSAASDSPEGDLEALKDALYESMSAYKDALAGSDTELKETARQDFLAAQRAYFDTKRDLLGEDAVDQE